MKYRECGQKVNIPLYKYYGNLEYAKDAIEQQRIHLEMPSEYNDIYDSSFNVNYTLLKCARLGRFLKSEEMKKYYDFLSEDELEELRQKDLSIGNIIDYLCDINSTLDKEKFIEEAISFITGEKIILQAENNKISCFSEVNDSLLMWAYYANSYAGVCLRFNAVQDKVLSEYCRKVQYSNHYGNDKGFGHYFRKSIQWSHEQEWRIVCDTTEQYLPIDSIDAIYLGIRMEKDIIQEFVNIGKRHNLEVYKMTVSDKKYEVLFNKIV